MVSWGRSFLLAVKVILFSIIWYIIGGIIIGVGVLLSGASLPRSLSDISAINIAGSIVALIVSAIGGIIIGLGATASLIKVTIDESVKEAWQTQYYYQSYQPTPPPGPPQPPPY
ncbi:MAG: hypothetical protein J7K82_01220 [Thermoproteales archaeon]|nr:hypothetical protein [Thermoproteales archaeon]